jgi:aminopeptidase-like protein
VLFDLPPIPNSAGPWMHSLAERLYPICRSITGNGVRQTLEILRQHIPLEIHEVPSGTAAFDWTVPKEWNIRDAWIRPVNGEKIVDFRCHNLHVINYSIPFRGVLTLDQLKPHLHSLEHRPDAIPYRTAYYQPDWGFCLSHTQRAQLPEGDYEVCIDSTLEDGSLTYGEYFLPGSEGAKEFLVSCHTCHPSLCNDNLSGIAVAAYLAKHLTETTGRAPLSFRFLFMPGTIGAITWLSRHDNPPVRPQHGLVLTCVGDRAPLTYKRSRRGNALIDRAFAHLLASDGHSERIRDFSPYGYDERQYCSPGINLPVGCLMRSVHGEFPEYHTSDDNLDFITPDALAHTARACQAAFDIVGNDRSYINLLPKCEPQLGKRGLYASGPDAKDRNMAVLWVLNLSDGEHSLLDIAERAHLPFATIKDAANALRQTGLIAERDDAGARISPLPVSRERAFSGSNGTR